MRGQRVSLAKLSRRVRILIDSRRIMHHALRDAKRSLNAWRLRFIVSLCDTIKNGSFLVSLKPETGRTLQIRIHIHFIGQPCKGRPYHPFYDRIPNQAYL
jgi:23S rRNA-/tRNA-specific pseudouridylate synthase